MSTPDRRDHDPETWRELWQRLDRAARVRGIALGLVLLLGVGAVVTVWIFS